MSNEKYPYRILFVEDEKDIRDNYTRYLKRHFLHVDAVADGEEGYCFYKEKKPDIMILDINVPKLNGLELLRKIRQTDQQTKAIMLTAHADVKYLLDAAELKLVKYLVKPIARNDLKDALNLAMSEYAKFDVFSKETIDLGDNFIWNKTNKILYNESGEVTLTKKENLILSLLFASPNNVFTYDDIFVQVWDYDEDSKKESLKTIIKNIRKKLPEETIKNVFGVGYKF